MSWIFLALGGHLLNGIAFIIDKALLNKAFKQSGTYAALVGLLSVLALLAIPWASIPDRTIWLYTIGFGSLFVFALWSFFEALKHGEATRVVPMVGSLIPILVLVGSLLWLGESFSRSVWIGLALLIISTGLLASSRSKQQLSTRSFSFACFAAALFALSSLCGKQAFSHSDFWTVFVSSRVWAMVAAGSILLIDQRTRKELMQMIKPSKSRSSGSISGLTIVGQLSGGAGFLLVNAALATGSAALVNALQAVQYALIAIIGWSGGAKLRSILGETVDRPTIIRKSLAILLIALSLYLIAGQATV